MSTKETEIPNEKKKKMRNAIEEATRFRNELAKKRVSHTHQALKQLERTEITGTKKERT
jgi:hypothetical protein